MGAGQSAGLDNFTGDYVSGSFVTVTAVPEPGTIALLGVAAAIFAVARRRGGCAEPPRVP